MTSLDPPSAAAVDEPGGASPVGTPPTRTPLTRIATTMADGRELIYFDEQPDRERILTDPRDLPVVVPASEARFDALVGEWVGIAGHRQSRTYHPPADICPLCPSTPGNQSEIPSPDYDVVVFQNRFPSFGGAGAVAQDGALFDLRPGTGRCEVVCFTADHTATLAHLPVARLRTVIDAWADRTAALSAQGGVAVVFPFENRGVEIGVTLAHPHGQIYGYPFVTPKIAAMQRAAAAHRERTAGGDLFADLLAGELEQGVRVVGQNDTWVAFVPFAARWPVEVHLYPRRPVTDLTELEETERDDLAALYREVVLRMEGLFDDTLPTITGVYQGPVGAGGDAIRLHLQVLTIRRAEGRLKFLAGSESAMGAFVNDLSPEGTAARLRDVQLPTEPVPAEG
ncbi:UDPglucose--hexose-1-phosphate uridylyltransferase [Nakamurella flavida]|nr:galactose-1-phosphate uridylyltransferase [Nakamurella flavida]MDP9778827.1 UDPglucose--hexose-1-phosphate uridylyltransferase [Nakamurella flavida]